MTLTIKGTSLLGFPATIVRDGIASEHQPIPREALPDCESCEKPELSEAELDVVYVFRLVEGQQQRSHFSGHRFGLRFEAVRSAIEWAYEAGRIADRDYVMDHIWTLDQISCRIHNARVDAANPPKGG